MRKKEKKKEKEMHLDVLEQDHVSVVVSEEELEVQANGNLTRENGLQLLGLLRDSLRDLCLGFGGIHGLSVFGDLGLGATRQTLHDRVDEMLGRVLVQVKGNLVQSEDILERSQRRRKLRSRARKEKQGSKRKKRRVPGYRQEGGGGW